MFVYGAAASIRKCHIKGANVVAAILYVGLFVQSGCVSVGNNSGQNIYEQAANTDMDWLVRLATVEVLTDQKALANIAYKDKNSDVRLAAAERLTDQKVLAKIAVNTTDTFVRLVAIEKLTDQRALAKIAYHEKNGEVLRAAVERLTDQALLTKLVVGNTGARDLAVKKLTDQALLKKFATDFTDSRFQIVVLEALTDQAVLTNLVSNSVYWKIRVAAVRNITDQALLANLAAEDKDYNVRRAAAEALTDQMLLIWLVSRDSADVVRVAAAHNIADQAVLAKLAAKDRSLGVRLAALKTLADQVVLKDLAYKKDEFYKIRLAAVRNITDQAVLNNIAVMDSDNRVRLAAVEALTDQEALIEFAVRAKAAATRLAAVQQITDDQFLIRRLSVDPSVTVRGAIIDTLRETNSLRTVALHAYRQDDREHALNRLKERRIPLSSILIKHEVLSQEVVALSGESDKDKLLTLSLEGKFDTIRSAAARRIEDPAVLEQAAMHATDREVLKILLAKIEDSGRLGRIAEAATDRAMRIASAKKAKTKTWDEIFTKATGSYGATQKLGDALAAVSLYPGVEQDARIAVQLACLNLIRRGDESRIPELVELLGGYGDKRLAEDYLNCGQPDLSVAGRRWATARGYITRSGVGSSRAVWGGTR